MYFQYDTSGTPLGFVLNGTQYFYITNQMGDILAITDTDGNVVGNYEYDAWGKVLTADTDIAKQNPLRYRGYYYDNETEYYYLQSRYYDTDICRFINADFVEYSRKANIIDEIPNLMFYCDNNSVNYNDSDGNAKKKVNKKKNKKLNCSKGEPLDKLSVATSLAFFVSFYVVDQVLKLNNNDYLELTGLHVDSNGNYICKIKYRKKREKKKSFVLSLGNKYSWQDACRTKLNMEIVNSEGSYIQKELNKGASTSLTNSGPDVVGILAASATVFLYLVYAKVKAEIIKKSVDKVWGSKRVIKWNKDKTLLFNIVKGEKRLNGWYAYRTDDWGIKKL